MTAVTAVALREESLAGGAAIVVWLLAGVWLNVRFPADNVAREFAAQVRSSSPQQERRERGGRKVATLVL